MVWMRTPNLTEQYAHVERVSVVRAILSSRDWAYAVFRSKPSTEATTAPVPTFRKLLRDGFMATSTGSHVLGFRAEGIIQQCDAGVARKFRYIVTRLLQSSFSNAPFKVEYPECHQTGTRGEACLGGG